MPGSDRSRRLRQELRSWCDGLVADRLVTAVAIARVAPGEEDGELETRAGRVRAGGPVVDGRSLFDLASLTKPWTATLALWLDRRGELPLTTRLGELFSGAGDALASVSLEDLLRHRAGFVRWRPLYALVRDADEALERLLCGDWLGHPPEETYSDLDYLLWGLAAERATGRSYADLVDRLARQLPTSGVVASGEAVAVERAVECPLGGGREVELAAEVGLDIGALPAPGPGKAQDGNARFFDHPTAHAGLFSTSSAMAAMAREWLAPEALLSEELVERALGARGRFGLGWFRAGETAAGRLLGPSAFGHDGFTGGSLWLDRQRGRAVVMLAHRASLEVDLAAVRAELVGRAGLL